MEFISIDLNSNKQTENENESVDSTRTPNFRYKSKIIKKSVRGHNKNTVLFTVKYNYMTMVFYYENIRGI